MLSRVVAKTFHSLRRARCLKAGILKMRQAPIIGGVVTRSVATAISFVARIHQDREWIETPYGWIMAERAWEDALAAGDPEPEVTPVLTALLQPQRVFYDIGAHVGFYALLGAKAVRSGSVFAFEPEPENVTVLNEVIARNGLSNVSVCEVAVSDAPGKLSFARSPNLRSSGHLSSIGCDTADTGEEITVDCTTLDLFCETHPLPDVIKIDVEGAEAFVLRGARQVLRRKLPALLIEVHRKEYLIDIETELLPIGYRLQRLHRPDLPPFPAHYVATLPKEMPVMVSDVHSARA